MKELSIEEKAKRYDQAIKVAKSKIKNDKDHVLYEDDVIEIFPELRGSDDERIRKEIKDFFSHIMLWQENFLREDYDWNAWIAWLEKQGNLMGALQEANKKIGELVEENYYLKSQL